MFGLKKMQRDIIAQGIMLSQMKKDLTNVKQDSRSLVDEIDRMQEKLDRILVRQEAAKPKAKAPAKPRGRPRKKE